MDADSNLRRKMLCGNCEYFELSGVSDIPCPNCDEILGSQSRHPTSSIPAKSAVKKKASREMNFYEVSDSSTVRVYRFICKAASEKDAKGLTKRLYVQQGWHYNADLISAQIVNYDSTKDYHKWQGSGSSRKVIKVIS